MLREESSDPRIGLVTITRVKVSADLSTALVFWSPLSVGDDTEIKALADGLDSASGFVRSRLANNLDLRRTPALDFKYDSSIAEGSRTLAIMRSLDIDSEPGSAETTDDEHGEKT